MNTIIAPCLPGSASLRLRKAAKVQSETEMGVLQHPEFQAGAPCDGSRASTCVVSLCFVLCILQCKIIIESK